MSYARPLQDGRGFMDNTSETDPVHIHDGGNAAYRHNHNVGDFRVLLSRYAGYGAFSVALLIVAYAGAALIF